MHENLEIEYKTLVTQEQFLALLDLCGHDELRLQDNVYYDCEPSSTEKQIAMRIRDLDEKHRFTLKAPAENGVQEFEMDLPANTPEAFDCAEIQELFDKLQLTLPVHECGRMLTRRYLKKTALGELCMDHSVINGRDDYEIEFEVSGDPEEGKAWFLSLLQGAGIEYQSNPLSKYARCVLFPAS